MKMKGSYIVPLAIINSFDNLIDWLSRLLCLSIFKTWQESKRNSSQCKCNNRSQSKVQRQPDSRFSPAGSSLDICKKLQSCLQLPLVMRQLLDKQFLPLAPSSNFKIKISSSGSSGKNLDL